MIVVFDRQHFGKPSGPDPGAQVDLNNDGQFGTGEQEANLTPFYYLAARRILEKLGHSAVVLDNGWYSSRHKKANAIARANPHQRVAYCACHINAGAGNYAAFIHDERSVGGKRLASVLAGAFADAKISGIRKSITRAGNATNVWKRGYYTIKGIRSGPANISGVCLEPYFLDTEAHQHLTTGEGAQTVGEALANGLIRWGAGV